MKGFHYEGIVPQHVMYGPSAPIASKLTTDNWEECATLRAKQYVYIGVGRWFGTEMIRHVIASTPAPIMTFRRTLPALGKLSITPITWENRIRNCCSNIPRGRMSAFNLVITGWDGKRP